jgi:hypothetical protein
VFNSRPSLAVWYSRQCRQALKDAQLKLERALAEMKTKDILIAQLQQNGGRKGKLNPSSGLEYDKAIVTWGKKFAVLYEPWITVAAFGPYPEDGPPELETMPEIVQVFTDPKQYLRYTRVTLYQNIPEKFHELIDPAVFGAFATEVSAFLTCHDRINICFLVHEANELRSLQHFVCVPSQLRQDPEDTRYRKQPRQVTVPQSQRQVGPTYRVPANLL